MNGGSAVLASCIIRSCSSDSVPNVLRYESVVKPPVSEALCSFFTFGCAAPPLLCGLFGSCGERYSLFAERGLLIAVASLVAEHRV